MTILDKAIEAHYDGIDAIYLDGKEFEEAREWMVNEAKEFHVMRPDLVIGTNRFILFGVDIEEIN